MSVRWRRVVIFILGLLPLVSLVIAGVNQTLGGDPAKAIVLSTGEWALRFLIITLAVTPLVRVVKWRWVMIHRRMLGLYSLFYAFLHLVSYYLFILGSNLELLVSETIKRPYILVGMPALIILALLGVTSTKGWMKRLGKRWQRLHRWVYPATLLALVHLIMQIRSSYYEATVYGAFVLLLLGYRVFEWRKRTNARWR
ncbi:sulfite oxidase heme-binding subunit YedZ [Vibrio sp. WJH972]